MSWSWKCPFCNHYSTLSSDDRNTDKIELPINNKHGLRVAIGRFTVCPNPKCKEFSFDLGLWKGVKTPYGRIDMAVNGLIKHWQLIPSSIAKVFPSYIPQQIRNDYQEACEILTSSPKASATLARRCLQGMIRDFWKVKTKTTLAEEIEAIEEKVDPLTWEAIDSVRSVGNIGAHMEKDINLIIDVEPEEAKKLISLIETLIQDWYINRHERELRLKSIKNIALTKKTQKRRPRSKKA